MTFLFTDIGGSTRLAQQYPDSISGLLERHHTILKAAIASIAATRGSAMQAVRLCAATHAVEGVIGVPLLRSYQNENQPYMLATRTQLGEETYTKAFSEGSAMSMEQAAGWLARERGPDPR